jgi:hypothetical protein
LTYEWRNGTFLGMEKVCERQDVQKALTRAKDLLNMAAIARAVGWSESMLWKFRDTGTGAEESIQKIARILRDHNFLDIPPPRRMAADLRLLADYVERDDITAKEKVDEFRVVIRRWKGGIKAFSAMREEGKESFK